MRIKWTRQPTAVPRGPQKYLLDRLLAARMRVADDQLDAPHTPRAQALQDLPPQDHVFAEADIQTQDLAHAVGAHPVGNDDGHALHAMVLAHVLVAGIDPYVGVLRIEPPGAEGGDLRIEASRHAADFALADPGDAQALHQGFYLPRRDALYVGFGHHADQGLLAPLARFQPGGEVAALPQLGEGQLQRAHPRVPGPRAVAVALRRPLVGPLVALRPDLGADLRLHQLLHQPAHALLEKVGLRVLALAQHIH
jgi:hypothetical protein